MVLQSRPYFFLTNWSWYEWLGLLAPFAVLAAMAAASRHPRFGPMRRLVKALALFEAFFLAWALLISVPGPLERFAEIQPMRCLLLVYILMLLLGGCLLVQWSCGGRYGDGRCCSFRCAPAWCSRSCSYFPIRGIWNAWGPPGNSWVKGFDWIRANTPQAAYFALDPDYERLPGEDVHGFRAIAQRSMLADNGKDSGAVSMFPALAGQWSEQVEARRGWKHFERPNFLKPENALRRGLGGIAAARRARSGVSYQNDRILVCRIE